MLDKHKLALQLSMRKPTSAVKAKKQPGTPEKQSTKLVVRNVAFEATRKDVMSLFSPFGHMKSCRLPRKFDGTPRYNAGFNALANLLYSQTRCYYLHHDCLDLHLHLGNRVVGIAKLV